MTLDYYKVQLKETADKLSEFKKGILAVDESTKTIGKRLSDINLENTEENRQAYRGMLFTTPDLGKYISGAILYEETLYQKHVDGDSMIDKLTKQGIIPGIKVDTGLKVDIPLGYVGIIYSRSGLAFKENITAFQGVIDSGYEGEVGVLLYNHGDKDYKVKKGDKIAQLVVYPVRLDLVPVEDEEATRGESGFGSTGK